VEQSQTQEIEMSGKQWSDLGGRPMQQPRAGLAQLAAATLLLAGCATGAASGRVVVLESDSYGCGAVEGLGCGLAIAPVLETMDRLDGVAESSVSWDGRTFRIEFARGADPERVAAEAAELLEGEACCVTPPRGKAKPGTPDEWFDSRRTVALSRHEADVLAAEFVEAVSAETALDAEASERLHAVTREELRQAFERAHAAGGGVERLHDQIPEARARFAARLEFLAPERRDQVLAALDRRLAEG
jgi:hypothetical protein